MKYRNYQNVGLMILAVAAILLPATTQLQANDAASQARSENDGPIAISASVNKETAQVADPIELVLTVRAPQGTRVELPRVPDRLGDFEVTRAEAVRDLPAAENPAERLWELRLTLETLATGDLTAPPLEVQVASASQPTAFESMSSQPIKIHIASVLEGRADPTKFRDVKGPVDAVVPEPPSTPWIGWAIAGAAGLGALATAVVLLAMRKRGPSPSTWALSQIDDLQELASRDPDASEEICRELTDVVRQYFELEFDVPTLSRTGGEFLALGSATPGVSAEACRRLESLLSVADDVKFARFGVGSQLLQQALDDARAFVNECRAQVEAATKGAA